MRSTPLSFLVWALIFGSLLPLTAQAALYAPGETLDPACAPTDVNCGVQSPVGAGATGQVPYYAANGSVLTATSTVTILQNGNVGVGTTTPSAQFSVTGAGLTTGRALVIADSANSEKMFIQDNGTVNFRNVNYLIQGNVGGALAPQAQTFTIGGCQNFANANVAAGATGTDTDNSVCSIGWNMQAGSGRLDASKPAVGISFENNWRQGSTQAQEFHLTSFDTAGNEHRFFSAFLPRNGGAGSAVSSSADLWNWYTYDGVQKLKFDVLNNSLQFIGPIVQQVFTNNMAYATQRNAAGNAQLSLPYYDNDDRIRSAAGQAFVGPTPTTGTYPNIFAMFQPTTLANNNGTIIAVNFPTATGTTMGLDIAGASAVGLGARVYNQSNTANAHPYIELLSIGTSGGDPHIRYSVNGATTWYVGLDNSDGDKFKWSSSGGLGSGDKMTLDISGNLGIGTTTPGSLLVVASSTATGTSGLFSVGTTSSSIFTVLANGNAGVGTTTPGQALSVVGNIISTGTFASGGTINFGNVPYAFKLNVNGAIGSQAPVFTMGAIGNFPGANAGAPAGQEDNTVAAIGWNLQVGNGRLDTSKPASGIVFENNYRQGGVQAFETHITMTDTSGLEHRGFTWFAPRDGGLGSSMAMQTDSLSLQKFDGTARLNFNWAAGTMQVYGGSVFQYETNNAFMVKQLNAAGNSYIGLPYYDNADKLNLGTATTYTTGTLGVGTTTTFGKIDSVNLGVPLSVFNTDQTAGFRELARFAGGSNADASGARIVLNDSASYADSRNRAAFGWGRQLGVFGFDIFAGASLTQVARFESTGNVGIGSTSPFARLSVKGAGNTSGVNFQTTNSSNSPLFTILDSGNVGIGTTTPLGLLSINPIAGNTGPAFVIGSTTKTLFSVANTGDVTINGSSGSTCTIGNGTGGTSCTSDERLKTDIALIVNPLEGIQQLRGVTFKWSDRSKDQSQFIGVIAQDVQKVFPQAVTTTAGGYLSVDYASLVAPLIEAVKELAGKVSVLADTVAGFKQQFTTNKLCVGSTCVTEAELKTLLQNSGQQAAPASSESGPIIITDVPPVETPSETASSTSSTPEEAFIPETPLSTDSSGSTTPSDAVSS